MGKQYNKVEKRRRLRAYKERLKEAAKAARKAGGRAKTRPTPAKKAETPAAAAA